MLPPATRNTPGFKVLVHSHMPGPLGYILSSNVYKINDISVLSNEWPYITKISIPYDAFELIRAFAVDGRWDLLITLPVNFLE